MRRNSGSKAGVLVRFTQYMTSSDLDVVAAIALRVRETEQWQSTAREWAKTHGGTEALCSSAHGVLTVEGIAARERPSLAWRHLAQRTAGGDECFTPLAGTPEGDQMKAVRLTLRPIPGLPLSFDTDRAHVGFYVEYPEPFVHAGVAYLALEYEPASEQRSVAPGGHWNPTTPELVTQARERHHSRART